PGERPLAIDEPLGPMQWREIGLEGSLVGEAGVIAGELQAARVVGGDQHLQHKGAEQPRQDFHWQEIFGTAADPPCAVERYPATRHDHMYVRVMGHRGSPGVKEVKPILTPSRLGSAAIVSIVCEEALNKRS